MSPAPSLFASGLQVVKGGNDFLLQFTRHAPGHTVINGQVVNLLQIQPLVDINVSVMTLKDISLILAKLVADHEAEFGEIQTPFTREQATEKAS